ncbi:uncharacterized protein I303_102240 [Kwoniella dejecticola CBS 10117]|uniref:phosphatidylinositol-3,4,5-trisphosphate 3-phosphatase n=1 Tax=Kwoniella dejecticola CBS 10117 TaxID=1296121 RepID=A0A1A6ABJ1_9TREE|nr:uncharacterized protein I303_01621 [Kwoniella dejecticola CBS 10117]OBR87419.1 hypothetical protein I303_01621 [Kwoniella dejecticola CBS 10117]
MSFDYVRKIVSGKKARFIDPENAVNLDLVYVTDRIIIMGYPAVGVAGLYRNRRRDVLKFINSRHGEKWWIWNLCPLYENAYSPESMHGRVSRYPFPDHHPPPLPLLPLAVREMTAWLEGDAERVAIIHCKAGKGRSGTLLCSYLLSLPELPPPPQLDRSYTHKELKKRLEERESGRNNTDTATSTSTSTTSLAGEGEGEGEREGWVYVGSGKDITGVQMTEPDGNANANAQDLERTNTPAKSEKIEVHPVKRTKSTSSSTTTLSNTSSASSVDIQVQTDPPYPIDIGDEGQPGTEGQIDRKDGRVDEVFKLHSSRRMKPTSSGRGVSIPSQRRWCRYIHLLFNNQAPPSYTSPKTSRVRLTSITLLLHPPTGWQKPLASLVVGSGGTGQGRAWASVARYDDEYVEELKTRGGTGEGVGGQISWGGVGGEGRFDTHKMFRSCGKMVSGDIDESVLKTLPSDHEKYVVHHLTPSNNSLILDRSREFRMKFHIASVPLGWTWMIPSFHLPEPPAKTSAEPPQKRTHTLHFPKSQVDFPLGPGQAIHEILVRLEEVPEDEKEETARLMSDEEERREGVDDTRGEKVVEDGE